MANNDYTNWDKQQLIQKIQELENQLPNNSSTSIKKEKKPFDFSKHGTRFVALRFSYLGWNYNGLALQNHITPLPTVEEVILKALFKAKLIPSLEPTDFNFSRCGRTDKGVSAMSQVISLNIRSNFKTKEECDDINNDDKEIDYITNLNKLTPSDIIFKSVCLHPPPEFDARFSCQYRHYRYFFDKNKLDLSLMQEAAKKYEGEHDFRNFCKIDGSKQITNHCRKMLSAKILKFDENIYFLDLKGTAFLWHQVRCMMAILFLVGAKLESPSIVDYLFDVKNNPQRPVYEMADDLPLVLYDCNFAGNVKWKDIEYQDKTVYSMWLQSHIRHTVSSIFYHYHLTKPLNVDAKIIINVGDGRIKPTKKYVALKDRQKLDSVEVQNAKFKKRKPNKFKDEFNV